LNVSCPSLKYPGFRQGRSAGWQGMAQVTKNSASLAVTKGVLMTFSPVKDSGSLLVITCPAHLFTFFNTFSIALAARNKPSKGVVLH
jgi:hypothetical protein